jgi:hypothetical protein
MMTTVAALLSGMLFLGLVNSSRIGSAIQLLFVPAIIVVVLQLIEERRLPTR